MDKEYDVETGTEDFWASGVVKIDNECCIDL